MTKIRARCPSCGDVEFGIERIVVVGAGEAACTYKFCCPTCESSVSRSAVPDVIELLLSAGVRREDLEVEPRSGVETTALTENDVSAFRELLQSSSWFEDLESAVRTNGRQGPNANKGDDDL